MSYTYNQVGIYLQEKFQLCRNPYDRFVHFNFGLLISIPLQDYLIHYMKVPTKWSYVLTITIILSLATIFELIEWLVALSTDSETGETYVATQGDVWDAHKDIALALIACTLIMLFLKFKNKK